MPQYIERVIDDEKNILGNFFFLETGSVLKTRYSDVKYPGKPPV